MQRLDIQQDISACSYFSMSTKYPATPAALTQVMMKILERLNLSHLPPLSRAAQLMARRTRATTSGTRRPWLLHQELVTHVPCELCVLPTASLRYTNDCSSSYSLQGTLSASHFVDRLLCSELISYKQCKRLR